MRTEQIRKARKQEARLDRVAGLLAMALEEARDYVDTATASPVTDWGMVGTLNAVRDDIAEALRRVNEVK